MPGAWVGMGEESRGEWRRGRRWREEAAWRGFGWATVVRVADVCGGGKEVNGCVRGSVVGCGWRSEAELFELVHQRRQSSQAMRRGGGLLPSTAWEAPSRSALPPVLSCCSDSTSLLTLQTFWYTDRKIALSASSRTWAACAEGKH